MRHIRKISLQDASGARYGFNGDRGVYASALSGFGLSLEPAFADLRYGFFEVSSDENEPQIPLAFTLTFTRNAYSEYKAFVDWVAAAGVLTILYNPTGAQEYCRSVSITSMQKGELNRQGWLEVPVILLCKTPWYLPVPSSMALEIEDAAAIKRYTYQYTPDLRYGSDGLPALSGNIPKSGHIPAALELCYYGQIVNPMIRLTGKTSGKTYGICALKATLEATDTLKFSTRYENSYVKKIDAHGVETDLLDVLDLSLTPFFRVPVTEPCVISIESESAISGRSELLIYYYFRSV